MKKYFIILLLFTVRTYANNEWSLSYAKQETQNIYRGETAQVQWSNKKVRFGVLGLKGEFSSGAEVENSSFLIGATQAFQNFYLEWDSEFSANDIRKPYSNHSLTGYYSTAAVEMGLGFRYADFATEDADLALVSARHYFNDFDYLSVMGFFDTKRSNLKSYSIAAKKRWEPGLEFFGNFAWGRAQEDIGIIQDFKAATARMSYPVGSATCGLEVTRSWGDLILDSIYGIACHWK